MGKYNILIIEDEVKIARFIQLELKHEGYNVDVSHDGREGLSKILESDYDLIILDIMLPSLNGMEILRRTRQAKDVNVIMLSAKSDITDRVMGLDIGADDYMTKPFAIEELLARIRNCLKRNRKVANNENTNILKIEKLIVDCNKYNVSYDGERIDLTKKEFDLLRYMIENRGIVVTRDNILEKIWGYEYIGDTNVVDVYVRYLRSKIDNKYNVKFIYTVRGVGYKIENEK